MKDIDIEEEVLKLLGKRILQLLDIEGSTRPIVLLIQKQRDGAVRLIKEVANHGQ